MKKTLRFIPVIFLVTLLSCEESKPSIEILSPANGQTFAGGETIHVIAKITDSDAIQAESIIITSENNDGVFNFEEHEFHGQSHVLYQTVEAPPSGSYTIEIGGYGHSSWTYSYSNFYVN